MLHIKQFEQKAIISHIHMLVDEDKKLQTQTTKEHYQVFKTLIMRWQCTKTLMSYMINIELHENGQQNPAVKFLIFCPQRQYAFFAKLALKSYSQL